MLAILNIDHARKCHAILVAALDAYAHLDGKYVARNREAVHDANRAVEAIPGAWDGILERSMFIDPASKADKINLAPLRAAIANCEAFADRHAKHADNPAIANLYRLDAELRAAWNALKDSMPREDYLGLLRDGALPRISWY